MDQKYSGLTLDPARFGDGHGVSMNKSNPGRASVCKTMIGTCYLDPDRPTSETYGCNCWATGGEKISGTAH